MPPAFLYGTAWKEDDTARLVRLALAHGFRGIDTANQRKHYDERAVGDAIADVRREDLFLQTKFTHVGGQDHRLPYDPDAPVREQVAQSFARSLEHLRTTWLDAYVLHGPSRRQGLAPRDLEAWRAMETLQRTDRVRRLGVSNVTNEQLELLLELATIAPAFVQNRCYASAGWDQDVRATCRRHGIVYQGFSLLTANRRELGHPELRAIAARRAATPEQIVFRFALDAGILPLTGTTSAEHMKEDLAVLELPPLDATERKTVEAIGV